MPSRREILRRLGAPQYRFVCACGSHVDALVTAHIWPDDPHQEMRRVEVCRSCALRIRRQNVERTKAREAQRAGLRAATIAHIQASGRSSSKEYLEACARMRRELGLL